MKVLTASLLPFFAAGLSFAQPPPAKETPLPALDELRAMRARFVPVDVRVDLSKLEENERCALAKMIDAARMIDAIFLRQRAPRIESILLRLLEDESPLGRARLDYFLLNKGPWSELDDDRPFVPDAGPKPGGANYYPSDATRAEVDAWLKSLPEEEGRAASGFFTTIRRAPGGGLRAVPYSMEYQTELTEAARLLSEAAVLTKQSTLKRFLDARARAFLTNDYYESDVAWMELDASIEPTIGPYEVYEDEWFNFKAAFEAFISVVDAGETTKLGRFAERLQELENHLPIDPQYRNPKLGSHAPIRVVNVVFTAGDANHGVQTAAFNLPNDERVVAAKGSKRVMLKNVQEAKFSKVLVPIAGRVLAAADRSHLDFDAFFTHILMHELMHGLGPQTIRVGGRETTVRQELKELNGALEEAKADIAGLWALQYLIDAGALPKAQERAFYTTFLASTFRTLRFGLGSAHARGMALQLNRLLDGGGFVARDDGTFGVDLARAKRAVAALTREIMTIQATGSYAAAKELLEREAVIRPEVRRAFERLADLPVDIEPRFVTARELAP